MTRLLSLILCEMVLLFSCAEGALHHVFEGPNGSGVTVDLSKDKLELGENLHVGVMLKYPKGYAPVVDELSTHLLNYFGPMTPPFRLVSMDVHPAVEAKDVASIVTQSIDFVLSPQRTGVFHPSFLQVAFVPTEAKEGNVLELITDIFTVEVVASANKTADPIALMAPSFPINTPYSLVGLGNRKIVEEELENRVEVNKEKVLSHSFPWLFLLSCGVMLGVFWLIKHTAVREVKPEPKPIDVEAARRAALYELTHADEIRAIDSVMRNYFDEAYKIRAPNLTTEEFLGDMVQAQQFDEETVRKMSHFFGHIDAAKYSSKEISSDQAQKLASIATQIITTLKK